MREWWQDREWGDILIVFALAVSIPRVIGAFSEVETDLSIAALRHIGIEYVTGFGFSILVTGGSVYCWRTFQLMGVAARKASNLYKTRWIPLTFGITQLLMELLLVWPVLTANIQDKDLLVVLRDDLGYVALAVWTLMAASLPIVVVAGVAVSLAFRQTFQDKKRTKSDRKSGRSVASGFVKICGACGRSFNNANTYSGHWKAKDHQAVKAMLKRNELREEADGNIVFPDGSNYDIASASNGQPQSQPTTYYRESEQS